MPQQADVWLWKLWLALSFVVVGCATELADEEFDEEELDDEDEE